MKPLRYVFTFLVLGTLAWGGTITGTMVRPNGLPISGATMSLSLSQPGVSGVNTITTDPIYCGTDANGNVVQIADPTQPATLSANLASGTLPAGTYYVTYAFTGPSNTVTNDSPESVLTLTGSGTLIAAPPTYQPANAVGYKLYIGTTSGGETLQATITGFTSYSQSTPLAAGSAPTAANTTSCTGIYFNDAIVPSYTVYSVNFVDGKGRQIAGYPQRYYLQGAAVSLSVLTPAQNLYARFPNAIVSQPTGSALQSIAGPLSLTGYQLYAGNILSTGYVTAQSLGSSFFGALLKVSGTGCTQTLQLLNVDTTPTNPNKYLRVNKTTGALELVNSACTTTILSVDDSGNVTLPGGATIGNTASGALNLGNSNTTAVVLVKPAQIASVSQFGGIATVANGQPVEYATVDLTAQSAAVATTTLYAVPASGATQYRVTWNAKVTTAATTSSTLGALTIVYTDPDGTVQTITAPATISAGTVATTSTGNTTATVLVGMPMMLNCKFSTNITYAFAYVSSGATAMQFNLHLRLEAL